jgi:uncharacterized membrane protein YpjA
VTWTRTTGRTIAIHGLLTWAIPFVISLAFYGPRGVPRVDVRLIKSVMLIVGGGAGGVLLVRMVRRFSLSFTESILVGLFWCLCNLALDAVILVPMTHMGLADYVWDIGARYLLIPIMAGVVGAAARTTAGV